MVELDEIDDRLEVIAIVVSGRWCARLEDSHWAVLASVGEVRGL